MTGSLLQVRYTNRGFDVPFERLGVAPAKNEGRIKQALARYLTVPGDWLNGFIVQRGGNGNVLLRQAIED